MIGGTPYSEDSYKMIFDQGGWLSTGSDAYDFMSVAPLAITSTTTNDSDFVQPFARFAGFGDQDGFGRYLDIIIADPANAGGNSIIKENDFSIGWSDYNEDNTSPGLVLAPYSASNSNAGIRIDVSGNVGVGISDPRSVLDISGDLTLRQRDIYLDTTNNTGIGWYGTSSKLFSGKDISGGAVVYGSNGGALGIRNGLTENIAVRWIPDSANNTLVLVDGKIKAREVQIKTNVWADYVFAKNYNLMSLGQLEQYIKVNKHLPDVITEKEAVDKGVNLGDMQTVLLKKIEEISLYLIELKKENDNLKEANDVLKKRVDAIENTTK